MVLSNRDKVSCTEPVGVYRPRVVEVLMPAVGYTEYVCNVNQIDNSLPMLLVIPQIRN